MAQDIDFSRMLDELDEPEATGFGTPVAEPSQEARDAFGLPGSTQKLIDDVVSAREADRRQSDYVEKGKEIISGLTDPQQYAEFAKGIIPGAVSMGGTAIQSPDTISAKGQQGAAKFGRKQLEVMDRIDRGEAVPEMEDPIGYAYMSQEQRQAARAEQQQATAAFNPTPIEKRPFFKAGEKVQQFAKDLMPAAPGYEESTGRQLGEGMGSMAFGLPLAYFGGPVVAGTAFGSAGIGEATQRAVEYDRKEKAAGRPGLTEDQIATAGILGVGPGATDMLPVEILVGRLPLPIPPTLRRPVAMAIGRIGGQAFIEGAQEGGQAFLQNLIAREVYNPSQPLVDGIGHEMGIGAGVGGIAQTAKELGVWMLKSGAIRKKKGVHDSLVEHEKEQKEAAEVAAAPEDTRALAASQEGETPRLKKGEGSVRGPVSTEPAIQDAERLLSEIGQGTIAQASGAPVAPESEGGAPAAPAPASDWKTGELRPVSDDVYFANDGTFDINGLMHAPDGTLVRVYPDGSRVRATFSNTYAPTNQGLASGNAIRGTALGAPISNINDLHAHFGLPPVDGQSLRGEAPVAPATEAPAAVSTPAAPTLATEPAVRPASLTQAIEEGSRQAVQEIADLRTQGAQTRESVNQLTDETRARFAEVLSSKARRSDWGKAAGVTEEQVRTLIDEAVADGRLTMRKGQPVRTAKARAPSPQTEVARAAVSVPMGRAAEVRLEGVKSDVAYKHAAAILGAGRNRETVLKKLAADKRATRAVLDEIHLAVTGKPSKSLKSKGAVLEALAKVEEAAPASEPAPLPQPSAVEGALPASVQGHFDEITRTIHDPQAARTALDALDADKSVSKADLDALVRAFTRNTKKPKSKADAIRQIGQERLRQSHAKKKAQIAAESMEFITGVSAEERRVQQARDRLKRPPGDSYAIRSLQSIEDPVAREHARALIDSGTNVEGALGVMLADRRVSPEERAQIAEAYVGAPFTIDPVHAVRGAAAERGRDITSALLGGFVPEVSPSNLRTRDEVVARLEEMAKRLPKGAELAIRDAFRVYDPSFGIRSLEGGTSTERRFGVLKKILAVSLEYGPDVALRTFTHEEIHLLKEMGVFSAAEWKVLEGIAKRRPKKAEAERIIATMLAEKKIDQAHYDEQKTKAGQLTYRELYDVDAKYGDYFVDDERGTRAEKLVEETVAWAAGDWSRGRSFASPIERVFQKIRDFLESIQNALNGLGFRSANDIFESIWSGELTRKFEEARERRFNTESAMLDVMQEEGITAMAIGPVDPNAPIDGATGQSMRRDLDALGYFSGALEAAKTWNQKKGTPEQALMWLKKSGVKDAEIEATGLFDFLSTKGSSVTRDDLVAHLEQNRIELTEVRSGGPSYQEKVDAFEAAAKEDGLSVGDYFPFLSGNVARQRPEVLTPRLRTMLENLGPPSQATPGEPRWKQYSLDPSNPTYRETVLHLPGTSDLTQGQVGANRLAEAFNRADGRGAYGRVPDTDFRSGHFPEPNIIGHMMTSMTTHQGKPVYTVDQIQSDWGQKLRDDGVRDEARVPELQRRFDEANAAWEAFPKEKAEKAEGTYDRYEQVPFGWNRPLTDEANALLSALQLARAELETAMSGVQGNPLVNTTDQWVNTTLRRAIRQAAEAGADYIAIPTGDTVLKYNPGDTNGMREFYGSRAVSPEEKRARNLDSSRLTPQTGIVPKNLRNLLQKIDKSIKPEIIETLDSPSGKTMLGDGFTLFPLTDKVKQSVISEGQPMFAFAGEKAKTADLDALDAAKRFETEGKSREFIWRETGWFRGVDGRWRFEIDDSKSKLRAFGPDMSMLAIELTHDPLFEAYPQLVDVEFYRNATRSYVGEYNPGQNLIPGTITISKHAKDRRSTTLHEAQHAVQDIERMAEGGDGSLRMAAPITGNLARHFQQAMDLRISARDLDVTVPQYVVLRREWASDRNNPMPFTDLHGRPYDAASIALAQDDARIEALQERNALANGDAVYRRLAGEVEARTVQKRMNMSPDEREDRPPWLDYDVPEDQQIVRMPVEGEQRSMASVDLDMSPQARKARAEAMGFDTNRIYYHGTHGAFDEFRLSDSGSYGRGVYLTSQPEMAGHYADGDGGSIIPVYVRGKIMPHREWAALMKPVAGEVGAQAAERVAREVKTRGYTGVGEADGTIVAVFDPKDIRSVNAAFDPDENASTQLMAAFGPTPSQSTPEGESPSLNKIISDLKKTLGMPVSQGLWGMTVRQGARSARVRPPSNVKGQFDRETGNVSIRQSRDIETLAHEGGHYLESILGNELAAVKQQFAQALTGNATPSGADLSEGFARWFADYILDPDAAKRTAPGMTEAFDEMLEAERPDLLSSFDTIQSEYQRYVTSDAAAEANDGLTSQYDGTAFSELAKDKMFDNIRGWISAGYEKVVDQNNASRKSVEYLLKLADFNGIRDEDGRPISLKASDNFYKRLRMFGGSYGRGRSWLEKGVSDLETGQIIGPSLKAAVEKALGDGPFNKKRYADFNQYLISTRAVAEYDRLEAKEAAVKTYNDTIARLANARPMLAERVQRDQAILDRRQDALTRANAMLSDRQRMLKAAETRLQNIQERLDGVLADIAEAGEMDALAQDIADPLAENAVSENYGAMVARRRRQVQNLERQQREAVRAVERLSEEVSGREVEVGILEEEIRQTREGVARGRQQLAQLEDASTRLGKERDLTQKRGASRAPHKKPKAWHVNRLAKLESPEFQEAADMVHDFLHSLLRARLQAGFISQELFDELAARKDWYVPFFRDMSDIPGAGAMFNGSGVKKWSMFKKFDGSDRSIIAPLETISQEAYNTAQQIAFNDAVKALINLAERVGPGGGKIAERLARTTEMPASHENFEKLKQDAIALGLDPLDAHMMVQRMEMNFSDGDIKVILSPEHLGPKAKPQLPMWQNGERVMIRLPDPEFGKAIFDGINAVGKDMSDILLKAMGMSATAIRVGATTHWDFIGANIWRDMWQIYKIIGAAPVLTHLRGGRIMAGSGDVAGMPAADFQRLYNEMGGIAGGINVNAQTALQQRDVKDLLDTNISKKSVAAGAAIGAGLGISTLGAAGGALGMLLGGPVGMAAGFSAGVATSAAIGAYAARHGEVFKVVEAAETAGRLGVAAYAYKRAKAHNPDLSDMEAMFEATEVARNLLDWNRRGSKMLVISRMVPFLTSFINGNVRNLQQMGAYGDRGSALKKQLGMVWKHQNDVELSKDEQRDLADAYKSYGRWLFLSGVLASMWMVMMFSADDEDEQDYQDIKDAERFRANWIKVNGVWVKFPVPHELSFPAAVGQVIGDALMGYDPRVGKRLVDAAYETLTPPLMAGFMQQYSGLVNNTRKDGWFGKSRPVVPDHLMKLPPHERFDAYTSSLSMDIANAMYQAGVTPPAPKMIDFFLTSQFASWGREVGRAYETGKRTLGMSDRPEPKGTDLPIVRRFVGDAARQSKAVGETYDIMADRGGEMTMAANGYRVRVDNNDPAGADLWLSRLDPEQKAWAIIQYYGSPSQKRSHPLQWADKANEATNEVMRDIAMDTLAPKRRQGRRQVRDFNREIELSPAKKTEVMDILTRLRQVDSRNAMVLLNRDGFQGLKIKDPSLIWGELEQSSPEVARHLRGVRQNKNVPAWTSVEQRWPEFRNRVLNEGLGRYRPQTLQ
jgi:hypothetical protein